MYLNSMFKKLAIIAVVTFTANTSAGLLTLETYTSGTATPDTLGGYAMTDFGIHNMFAGTASTINSPISGTVSFENSSGAALNMNLGLANSTSWWQNPESTNNDIFTTSTHWVKILLPENTRAFSFNVGASFNGRGWLEAYTGSTQELDRQNFLVSPNNTLGFGIYASNTNGSCGAISSVIVEPSSWGIGNFSINQSACTANVPEPGTLSLIGLGLLGLVVIRRRI